MKTLSRIIFLVFFLCCVSFISLSEASKECILIEPEEMQSYYEDDAYFFNNMFVFDIRSYAAAMRGKQLPRAMQITYEMFKDQSVYEIESWKGKNIFLVGEDTESTERFCRFILDKNYEVGDVYVLKGGMKRWTGPVLGDFNEVKCESVSAHEVKSMLNAEKRAVEIIDLRSSEDFARGHIPGSISEGVFNRDKFCLTGTDAFARAIQQNIPVVFIGRSDKEINHRCRSLKWVIEYENMYTLKDGLKEWDGPIKKGRPGIIKTGGARP